MFIQKKSPFVSSTKILCRIFEWNSPKIAAINLHRIHYFHWIVLPSPNLIPTNTLKPKMDNIFYFRVYTISTRKFISDSFSSLSWRFFLCSTKSTNCPGGPFSTSISDRTDYIRTIIYVGINSSPLFRSGFRKLNRRSISPKNRTSSHSFLCRRGELGAPTGNMKHENEGAKSSTKIDLFCAPSCDSVK